MKNKITKVMHGKLPWIAALLLVVISITCYQTYAWFSHQKKIAELQKVKEPNQLFISAAYAEDVIYFTIPKIDVSDTTKPTKEIYPFAVAGEYVNEFTLQLAHTTNVPFTYKIYEANINTSAVQNSVEYKVGEKWTEFATLTFDQRTHPAGTMLYLTRGTEVQGQYLNETSPGSKLASNKYHEETFGEYSQNYVQDNAEPLYWQKSGITSVPDSSSWGAKPFFKTFVLEIDWTNVTDEYNKKETDVIYISAYRDN